MKRFLVRFGFLLLLATPALTGRTISIMDVSLSVQDLDLTDGSEPYLGVYNVAGGAWEVLSPGEAGVGAATHLRFYASNIDFGVGEAVERPFNLVGSANLFGEAELYFVVRGGAGPGRLQGTASGEYGRWFSNVVAPFEWEANFPHTQSTVWYYPVELPFEFGVPIRLYTKASLSVLTPQGPFDGYAYLEHITEVEILLNRIVDMEGRVIPGAYFESVDIPEPAPAAMVVAGISALSLLRARRYRQRLHAGSRGPTQENPAHPVP